MKISNLFDTLHSELIEKAACLHYDGAYIDGDDVLAIAQAVAKMAEEWEEFSE